MENTVSIIGNGVCFFSGEYPMGYTEKAVSRMMMEVNMGEFLEKINAEIQGHLTQLVKTAGLPEGEDSLENLARAWLEKEDLFSDQIINSGFEEVDSIAADSARGALLLTYSGSLLNIGPLQDGKRHIEYSSIGLRMDVPDSASMDEGVLAEEVCKGAPAVFSAGPVQQSSPVYRIAIVKEDLGAEEEEDLLAEVTQLLTEDFVEVNKTIVSD